MQDKSIVGCLFRCKSSSLAATVIIVVFVSCTPFSGERRISHDCIKLRIAKCVPLQRITVFYLEVIESDAVQQHIHSGKVVSGRILLLSINVHCMTYLCCAEKQRATTASRVIHIAKPCATDKNNFSQNLADFLRSIELSGFFPGSCCKLTNHIFVGIAKNINLIRGFHSKLYIVQSQQDVADKSILVICRLTQLWRSKVYI